MSTNAARDVFVVKPAAQLCGERDLILCTPQEAGPNSKQSFFRVPVRVRPAVPAFLSGSRDVVGSTAGLRRVLLQFPQSFCHGLREYDNVGTDSERANLTLGFALYDHRVGPTPEQTAMMRCLDDTSAWIRNTLYGTDKIRTTLGLGPANMPPEKQRMAAEMMDLHIAKPLVEKEGGGSGAGPKRPGDSEPERQRARYCYVKIVPPSPTVCELPRGPVPKGKGGGWDGGSRRRTPAPGARS